MPDIHLAGLPPHPLDAPAPGIDAQVPEEARSVLALLAHRRMLSPLAFRKDPVPRAWVDALIEAATWAPNHGKLEPWRFVVVQGHGMHALAEARVAALLEVTPAQEVKQESIDKLRAVCATAPLAIALGAAAGTNPKIPALEDRLAVACAAQNILLAATSMGLAAMWSTGPLAYTPAMARWLGFEPPVECLGFIFAGFPAKAWPTGARRPLGERLRTLS